MNVVQFTSNNIYKNPVFSVQLFSCLLVETFYLEFIKCVDIFVVDKEVINCITSLYVFEKTAKQAEKTQSPVPELKRL